MGLCHCSIAKAADPMSAFVHKAEPAKEATADERKKLFFEGVKAEDDSDEDEKLGGNGMGSGGGKNCGGGWGSWSDELAPISPDPEYGNKAHWTEQINQEEGLQPDDLEGYKQQCAVIVADYFSNSQVDSALEALRELDPTMNPVFIKKLISAAMDGKKDRFDLATQLLMVGEQQEVISSAHVGGGFLALLRNVRDLQLDVPGAPEVLALFMAKAIVDGVISAEWISETLQGLDSNDLMGCTVLAKAQEMLKGRRSYERNATLRRTGAVQSVEALKASIKSLLLEFINSEDLAEACRAVWELDSPHFHHEVVKRLVVLSIDQNAKKQLKLAALLDRLAAMTTVDQIMMGFLRVFAELDDLKLDSPAAAETVAKITSAAIAHGSLPRSFAMQAPRAIADRLDLPALAVLKAASRSFDADKLGEEMINAMQQLLMTRNIDQFVSAIETANRPERHTEIVEALITTAIDTERGQAAAQVSELVAQTVSQLVGTGKVAAEHLEQAVAVMVGQIDHVMIDHPNSAEELTVFIARLIVDEALAPSSLKRLREPYQSGSCAATVLAQAHVKLSGVNRLELITEHWVTPEIPAEELVYAKGQIKSVLQEYMCNCDIKAVVDSLLDMNNHGLWDEVVKRVVVLGLDGNQEGKARVGALLTTLSANGLVTLEAMKKGFERVFAEFDDLLLDVPDAAPMLALILSSARANGCLSRVDNVPSSVQEQLRAMSVQESQQIVNYKLKAENDALKAENAALKAENAALKANAGHVVVGPSRGAA